MQKLAFEKSSFTRALNNQAKTHGGNDGQKLSIPGSKQKNTRVLKYVRHTERSVTRHTTCQFCDV